MPDKDVKVEEGGVNYLVVVTRWSALVIKVRGKCVVMNLKRRLGFSFTVIILA